MASKVKWRNFARRGLSLLMAMVMTLSLIQLSAFADTTGSDDQIEKDGASKSSVYYTYNEDEAKFELTDPKTASEVNNTGDEDWRVNISKEIRPTGTENKFAIDLTVETKQFIDSVSTMPDAAVVLVIDMSGSMGDPIQWNPYMRKIAAARESAKAFATAFSESGREGDTVVADRWISLVTFNGSSTVKQNWVNISNEAVRDDFLKTIDTLENPDGMTNIAGGLSQANSLLKGASVSSIESKYVVLLGDGAPADPQTKDKNSTFNGYSSNNPYYKTRTMTIRTCTSPQSSGPIAFGTSKRQSSSPSM